MDSNGIILDSNVNAACQTQLRDVCEVQPQNDASTATVTATIIFKVTLFVLLGLMLPLALAAAVRVPYTTSPCSDLGQVVNLSLSVA